jgi:hypothetical protein
MSVPTESTTAHAEIPDLSTLSLKAIDTTILFHGNCIDGWFSAYFAHQALTEKGATIQLFPIAPSQSNTWPHASVMENTDIWLLDVSVAEEFRDDWLREGALSVHCIDHHATACDHWSNAIDTTACAAVQTYRFFYPDREIPAWLSSVDRVDRWVDVTYEDRCLREFFGEISSLPVERHMNDAFRKTDQFIADYQLDPAATLDTSHRKGAIRLDKKDTALIRLMAERGKLVTVTEDVMGAWRLPTAWEGKTVLLMDTTSVLLDTTEAAHLAFIDDPTIDVFINYRKKVYYDVPKGARPDQRHEMIVYSARSRALDLTTGTIFQGHLMAAGASLVIGRAPHFPFLLDPTIAFSSKHRPRVVNPVKTPVLRTAPPSRKARSPIHTW